MVDGADRPQRSGGGLDLLDVGEVGRMEARVLACGTEGSCTLTACTSAPRSARICAVAAPIPDAQPTTTTRESR
jgi:hypothetical protein